ncbi:MAG: VWA domain-containing protein [Bacteroidota bacterium]
MVQYQHPEAFYLLFGLIPLLLLFLAYMVGRKRALQKMGEGSLIARLSPEKATFKHQLKFILICLAYVSMVVALANPQLGQSYETVTQKGIDLMVALDVSNSMLCEDEKPNRLARAKLMIRDLIDDLKGDKIGLIIFAGNAYLQVPITGDYAAAQTLLRSVNPDMVPRQGTAIGEAIRIANRSFAEDQTQYKAVVIISDGENHEGDALEAAKEAMESGTAIFTVGVGNPRKGSPIPVYKDGRQLDWKRNREGSIVSTRMDEDMLKQVAAAGSGDYFRLTQGLQTAKSINRALNQLEQQEYDTKVYTDYEDQFQIFLGLALLFLVLEYFLSERRNLKFSDWSIFKS